MKKLSLIIIAFILTTITFLPALAEGYTAIVLPNSTVDTKKINKVDNTDIEKLLARKIIDKMETSGTDYAPTLNVLRISIINNSNFDKNTKEPMNNVKAIAKAFGISKIVLVSSKTEMQNSTQQKEFWTKMNLPVITTSDPSIKVTTTVTLYNSKNDEVVYKDVFYKKLNLTGNDIGNEHKKLSALNSYYDELLPKLLDGMKESKETHAVRIISNSDLSEVKSTDATPVMMYTPVQKTAPKSEKTVTRKIKPDLTVKENVSPKKNIFAKLKESFSLKYADNKKPEIKTTEDKKEKPIVVKKSVIKKLAKENGTTKKTEAKKPADKVKKAGAGEILKSKYNDMKTKYITEKTIKAKNSEENVKYSAVASPTEDDTSYANKYIQTKPRTNAKGYIPHFDNQVNDI